MKNQTCADRAAGALEALRRAAVTARREAYRNGTAIVVMRDGKIEWISGAALLENLPPEPDEAAPPA